MQILSIARLRASTVQPPYWVGGQYIQADGRYLLVDPIGGIILSSKLALFENLQSGQLIQVRVVQVDGEQFVCDEAQIVANASPKLVKSAHPLAFLKFKSDVRQYFIKRGLCEVSTPSLVDCPGLEPSLEPFKVDQKYLPTSPEVSLKKLIGKGFTDIFEIRSCFRKNESSSQHLCEFTMLEWYRGFADLDLIIEDLSGLLGFLSERGWCEPAQVEVTDFASLFKFYLKIRLTPQTSLQELRNYAQDHKVEFLPIDSFSDIFHRLMLEKIEPQLAQCVPLVVRRFPPSMAALAKIDSEGWGDRFELYWQGYEIANAFNEVIDPDEQVRRWEFETSERKRLGTSFVPQDLAMVEALRSGVPPTGGIALGVERLYMACTGLDDIHQLLI